MMIKFLRHGTGSAAGAARYVLAERDHLNVLREGVKTLRGNAEMFSAIADSCGFKQRYTSGVIAFAPEDDPSDQELQDVLDSFEELAFAGLEKEDYHLFAVQHDEPDGSKHIHVLVPRVHLGSKKSLNIAPPNHTSVFYPWRDLWNERMGWASPKDPARRRRVGKSGDGFLLDKQKQKKGLKLEKDEREFIVDSIEQGVISGKIKNRTDVESFLRSQFLTEGVGIVSRVVKSSISVQLYEDGEDSKLGRPMRLTGAFFDHDFDADAWLALQAEKDDLGEPSQRPKKPAPNSTAAKELEQRVDEIKSRRAQRQSAYFAYEKIEIKADDQLDLTQLTSPSPSLRNQNDLTDSRTDSSPEILRNRVSEQRSDIKFIEDGNSHLSEDVAELAERVTEQRHALNAAQTEQNERERAIAATGKSVADAAHQVAELERKYIQIVRAIAALVKRIIAPKPAKPSPPPGSNNKQDLAILAIFHSYITENAAEITPGGGFDWARANPLSALKEALDGSKHQLGDVSDEILLNLITRRESAFHALINQVQQSQKEELTNDFKNTPK